jgi:hypothetical protein
VRRALISSRVILEIELVIFLGIPPLTRGQDLSGKRRLIPLLANLFGDIFSNLLLLLSMCENSTAVLGTDVRTLPILCRGVVHAIEEFEELAVGYDRGIKGHLEGFGVCRGERGKYTVSSSDGDSIRSPADCS